MYPTEQSRRDISGLAGDLPAGIALGLLLLLATVPLLFSLNRLELGAASSDLFRLDGATLAFEQDVRGQFPSTTNLIVLFDTNGRLSDPFLAALEALHDDIEQLEIVSRVVSPLGFERIRGIDDEVRFESLLEEARRLGLSAEARLNRLVNDEDARGVLVSADGALVAMIVTPVGPADSALRRSLRQALDEGLVRLQLEERVAGITGTVELNLAQTDALVRDIRVFAPLSLGLGFLILLVMFRRWLVVGATMIVFSASFGGAMLLLLASGDPFTSFSAALIPLLMATTLALVVHWFNALSRFVAVGMDARQRVIQAHEAIHRPALFTALTTAAAFLALSVSPYPVNRFGQCAAVAVLVQYFAVLWLLPAICRQWDRGSWPRRKRGLARLTRPIRRAAALSIRRRRLMLVSAAVLALAATPWLGRIPSDADLIAMLPPTHPAMSATQRYAEAFQGVIGIDVVLSADTVDYFKQPEALAKLALLRQWLQARPEVDRVVSVLDLLERLNWAFHNEAPGSRQVPDSRALIEQYLLLYQGRSLSDVVDPDFRWTRMTVYLNQSGSASIAELADALRPLLAALQADGLVAGLSGNAYLLSVNERTVLQGKIRGLMLAALVIFLLLSLLWRDPWLAALCMLPNLFPVLFVLQLMGFVQIELNVITVMVPVVLLGIAVDDTIHLCEAYRRRRRRGSAHARALLFAWRHAGRAVTVTTIALVVLFLVLSQSEFPSTVTFGLLSASGILAAWVFDMLVLPALLGAARVRSQSARPAALP